MMIAVLINVVFREKLDSIFVFMYNNVVFAIGM